MTVPKMLQRPVRTMQSIPKKHYVYIGLGLIVIMYVLAFFVPKQVAFSYAGVTCKDTLTLFPGLLSASDDNYEVHFKDTLTVGNFPLLASKTCFSAKKAPREGALIVGAAPLNGPFARTLYRIEVKERPAAQLSAVKSTVPVTKLLEVPLTATDAVYTYSLAINGNVASCKAADSAVLCDIPSLKLDQGEKYTFTLNRTFKKDKAAKVGSSSIETLRAVLVTESSIKAGQIVYDRSKVLTFVTDKPIASASAVVMLDGTPVELAQYINGAKLELRLKDELPREKTFNLEIKSIEALDGSSLVEPYTAEFKTSGGPKVQSVSVGGGGVGQSEAIVLTFDQPLSKTKDMLPLIGLTGGQATVSKKSDTQVVIQLGTLPLCQPFKLTVKQGIESEYDLASSAPWSFDSRTICYQTINYGKSLRGRPLQAQIFGSSGPVTMYVGTIHGNEPSANGLMRAWKNELEANPAKIEGKRVVLIPTINPDGMAAGTRTNSRGVNLNRNFPTDNWVRSIKDTDGTHDSGGGESPLSEPEASALARITTNYRPRLLLSFHAVGSLAIGDPGGYSAAYAARYASMVGYRDGTNLGTTNFDYNVTGAYEDWTYRNQGIPSIVIELSNYGGVYNAGHYSALWAMLE